MSSPLTSLSSLDDLDDDIPSVSLEPTAETAPDMDVLAVAQVSCFLQCINGLTDLHISFCVACEPKQTLGLLCLIAARLHLTALKQDRPSQRRFRMESSNVQREPCLSRYVSPTHEVAILIFKCCSVWQAKWSLMVDMQAPQRSRKLNHHQLPSQHSRSDRAE